MLNHVKSVFYGFSLFPQLFSFVFVGKLAFLSAVFRTLILWRWKFTELPQSIFGQARG
ncbi:hypothetical protein FORC53_1437 [Vibrio vulnificus]|uniref:Uncharacterized protein n=1 Tax=Vibrio vulnificus TaxID=672 RepID=A0A6S4Q819_VIBVL|nr:hypothetical protein FORC53_1437 [Vibrio vulnificus]BBE39057.1 conserved hypothetical protein [Vibrio vulnificus]